MSVGCNIRHFLFTYLNESVNICIVKFSKGRKRGMRNSYLIHNALRREKEIPLLYLNKIKKIQEGDITQPDLYVVRDFFNKINVLRMSQLHNTVVFDYNIDNTEINYSYDNIDEAVRDNIPHQSERHVELASDLISVIVKFSAMPVDNIVSFHPDVQPRPNEVLERFINIIESQTYKGVWSDIMRYPFDNRANGIRKHLLIGFAASTGKSIILEALGTLYENSAIFQPNREDNSFNAANWNADVIDKFVTLIDDDNPDSPVTEDYIKNFMSNNMPLSLARGGGKRWKQLYDGSSVVASNTPLKWMSKVQNSKRIILIKLDQSIDEMFTKDELNELHSLKPDSILNYVNDEPTQLFAQKNDWSFLDEDDTLINVKKYLESAGVVSNKEIVGEFGKQAVRDALGSPSTFTSLGKTIYGYRTEIGEYVETLQKQTLIIPAFKNKRDVSGFVNYMTIDEFIKEANEVANVPKIEQPLWTNTIFKTVGEPDGSINNETVIQSHGVVIDIDKMKAKNIDGLVKKVEATKMSALVMETSSSTPEAPRARVWFYRVKVMPDEYKRAVSDFSRMIKEEADQASNTPAHRFFLGSSNVIKVNTGMRSVSVDNGDGLLNYVKQLEQGNMEAGTFWALNRAKEDGDIDLMNEIIENSPADEKQKRGLKKQFNL